MDDRPTQDEGQGIEGEGLGGSADEAPGEAEATDREQDGVQDPIDEAISDPVLDQQGSAPDFEQLSEAMGGSHPAALSLLYDLDLPVAIELGRTRLSVQDILALGRGSVVQLDRQAGEPVDVFVGDRRFAEGEVVIVGEQFGVRITRIVNTAPVAAAAAG